MKKLILIIGALSVILISCGPTEDDAIKYNDSLIDITEKIIEKQDLFINQLDGHNVDSLKITYQLFVKQAEISIEELSKVKIFDDKNEFGNSASEFIATVNSIVNNEAKQMVELLSKEAEQYTEYDQEKLDKLASKFDEQNNKAFENLKKEQLAFSKEWNFKLNFDR
jgi:hypothetical protein